MRNPVGQLLVWYGRVYLVVERRRNWAKLTIVQDKHTPFVGQTWECTLTEMGMLVPLEPLD